MKTVKIPKVILADAIANKEWAENFVKNPSFTNLIYYFVLSDTNGDSVDYSDYKNWIKRLINLFKKESIDLKEFFKGYKYKDLKETYDEFAFATGFTDPETYAWQIRLATPLVEICDLLNIKIKPDKTPNDWWSGGIPDAMFETDFKEAVFMCSKKDCKNFARLFSKKPIDWFIKPKEENWWKLF